MDIGLKKYEALLSRLQYFLLSTGILAMLGVFSFISSFTPLPKYHTALFVTTYEHVHMAKSSKMLVFILFHVLLVVICYGGSPKKTPFVPELRSDGVPEVPLKVHDLEKEEEVEACAYGDKCDEDEGGTCGLFRGNEDGYEEDNDDFLGDGDEYFENDDEEEGLVDLRGRIEDFISQVNRTWKEELLKEKKLLCLVDDTESLYMLVPYEMV